jgi:hypothetical protein
MKIHFTETILFLSYDLSVYKLQGSTSKQQILTLDDLGEMMNKR